MLPKVTVLICCKDEFENLPACIASARLLADEILVADSGSTDGTLDLAQRMADRVIERKFVSMGSFRNWALPQARHDWVLVLDADERLTVELTEEIQCQLRTATKKAYAVPRQNFFLGHPLRFGDWARDYVTRLVRRDDCRYKLYTDHTEIELPSGEVGRLKHKLTHYTSWDVSTYLETQRRYALQQADLWYRNGRPAQASRIVLNPPLRFLRGYVARLGFLDGTIGFLVAAMTAYYSFLKQFFLWQKWHGRQLGDLEQGFSQQADSIVEEYTDAA